MSGIQVTLPAIEGNDQQETIDERLIEGMKTFCIRICACLS